MDLNKKRENAILNVYTRKGAKVLNGHGLILNETKNVPKDTILMFLAEPGYCMNIAAGKEIQRKFFESNKNLKKFFKSGRETGNNEHTHHVTNILSRTHFPKNFYKNIPGVNLNNKRIGTYKNMYISLKPNVTHKGMGFIKKLPISTKSTIKNNQAPRYNQTVGPLIPDMYKLSNLLEDKNLKNGGVFIISACRADANNKVTRFNITGPGGIKKPLKRGSMGASAALNTIYFPPKSGYRGATTLENTEHLNKMVIRKKLPSHRESIIKAQQLIHNNKTKYKTFRNLLSAAQVPASALTYGNIEQSIRKIAKLYNEPKNVYNKRSHKKLRSGALIF